VFLRLFNLAMQTRLLAQTDVLLLRPSLKDLLERFEPSTHNGAPLPGLIGAVVKGHWNSIARHLVMR
jgi:fatty acid/phospholipid biosynthesis enzyme